ncbi:TetR/AcrR family transcriptional regulator [Actinoplanes utahensis]|uniref:TetR family transcriptional regulator n=1 Tax=Actinoplanes utahensis TaxID=1869 RepID=A0A0A6UJZ6_ACTUT|nr:TetR/AcrR family transcriptional regulator C-terminal domain-containing protein [Actinoplanes utahensis]KHD74639.1 TetR family transcriptional regulator [Actinoplanes utahensis]GIF31528.1 TetR family transcriptional regulator [Actinoplanes utahensis]
MDSIWLREDENRPRRAPQLNRPLIVGAAVTLLDADGSDALTMRRIAQALGVTSTALYWHVRTKEDVLDLAVDEIFGEVPVPEPGPDWAADVRTLIIGWRAAMLAHPWAAALIGRPMLGPQVLARTEFLQSALVRGGLDGEALAIATRMLADYVIGAAVTETAWRRSGDTSDRATARRHITAAPDAYPTLAGSGHLDDARWPDDVLFHRGLDVLLAAVAALPAGGAGGRAERS